MNQKHKTYKTHWLMYENQRLGRVVRFDDLELFERLRTCKSLSLLRSYCDVFATPENTKILEDEGYIYEQ